MFILIFKKKKENNSFFLSCQKKTNVFYRIIIGIQAGSKINEEFNFLSTFKIKN